MSMKRTALTLQVDGTPGLGHDGVAGLGLVIRGTDGQIWAWRSAVAAARTCNEAEYQAVIAGLKLMVARYPSASVCCLSDSRVVVEQMQGQCAVRAAALRPLHEEAQALVRRIVAVRFVFIPRELNRLADALAWEALGGQRRLAGYLVTRLGAG